MRICETVYKVLEILKSSRTFVFCGIADEKVYHRLILFLFIDNQFRASAVLDTEARNMGSVEMMNKNLGKKTANCL